MQTCEDLPDKVSKVKKSGFNCDECGISLEFNDNCNRHVKTHKVGRCKKSRSMCTKCKISFTRSDSDQHLAKLFNCYGCEVRLSRIQDTQTKNITNRMYGDCDEQTRSRKNKHFDDKTNSKSPVPKIDDSCQQPESSQMQTGEDLSDNISKVKKSGFKCKECGKIFKFNGNLNRHIKTHKVKRGEKSRTMCTECKISFARFDSLQKHMVKIHSHNKYSINDHHRLTADRVSVNLKKHLYSANENQTLKNQYYFDNLENKDSQINDHITALKRASVEVSLGDAESLFKPTSDEQIYNENSKDLCHNSDTDDDLTLNLPESELSFNTHPGQTQSVDFEKPCKCKKCPKTFARADTLMVHMIKAHTQNNTEEFTIYKERRCYCKHCPRNFSSTDTLLLHMIKVHGCEENRPNKFAAVEEDGVEKNIKTVLKATCDEEDLGDPGTRVIPTLNKEIVNDNSKDLSHNALTLNLSESELSISTHTGQKQTVDIENRCKCKSCPKTFSRTDTLMLHIIKAHTRNNTEEFTIYKEGRTYCKHCPKIFSAPDKLLLHMIKVHTRNSKGAPVVCKEVRCYCKHCPESFSRPDTLRRHVSRVHQCEENVGMKSTAVEEYDEQKKINRPSRATCDNEDLGDQEIQSKPTSNEQIANGNIEDLLQHSDSGATRPKCINPLGTDDVKFNICYLCGKGFPSNSSFKAHMSEEYSSYKGYTCIVCGKSYKHLRGLGWHIKSSHDWYNCYYCCAECGERFTEKTDLIEHLQQHLSGKSDTDSSQLVKHEQSSTQSEESHQNTHQQLAVGDKVMKDKCKSSSPQTDADDDSNSMSHTCTKCKKCFASEPDLQLHLQIHEQALLSDNLTKEASVKDMQSESDAGPLEKSSNICRYYCEDCPKNLTLHYYCQECPKIFCYNNTLKQHIARLHPDCVGKVKRDEVKIQCTICGVFIPKSYLKAHMAVKHAAERDYKCNLCGQGFYNRWLLKEHIRTKHSNTKPYICSKCGKGFTRLLSLENHMKYLHGVQRSLPCAECGISFHRPQGLRKHMKSVHNGLQSYSCTKCGQRFTACSELEKHMEQHPIEQSATVTGNTASFAERIRISQCSECGEGFGQPSDLDVHMTAVHPHVRVIRCDHCGQRFKSISSLNMHTRHVHGIRNCYCCGECGKRSTYARDLKKHMKELHHGLNSFSCAECGHRFIVLRDLQKHIAQYHQVHQPEIDGMALNRKYTGKCGECGQIFEQFSDLKDHMVAIHPHLSFHICIKCGDTFRRAENLNIHLKHVHGKQKCYSCLDCGKSFNYSNNLRQHIKKLHHGLKSFSCSKCGHMFTVMRDLEQHALTCHQAKTGADTGDSLWHVPLEPNIAESDQSYMNTHYQLNTTDFEKMKESGQLTRCNDGFNKMYHTCSRCKKSFAYVPDLHLHLKTCLLSNNIGNHTSVVSVQSESFENNEATPFHNIFHNNDIADTIQNDTGIREYCQKGVKSSLLSRHTDSFNCIECEQRFTQAEHLKAHMTKHQVDVSNLFPRRLKPTTESHNWLRSSEQMIEAKDLGVPNQMNRPGVLDIIESQTEMDQNISEDNYVEEESTLSESSDCFNNAERVDDLKGSIITNLKNGKPSRFDSDNEIAEAYDLSTNKSNDDEDLEAQIQLYTCFECDERFSEIQELQDHQIIHRVNTDDVSVDAITYDEKLPDKKIAGSLTIKFLSCLECGEKFTKSEDLQSHKKTHAYVSPCSFDDNAQVKDSSDVAAIVLDEKPVTCAQCKESFTEKGAFNKHIETHITATSRHLCKECGKCYKNKAHLHRHMVIHTGSKPHCCDKCGERFYRKDLLQYHDKTYHSDLKPPRPLLKQCSLCSKKVRDLDSHMNWHRGIKHKRFLCTQCGKSIADKGTYERHMERHEGIKAFPCSVCDKRFATPVTLKAHMSKHTGDMPCQCEICGRGFALRSRLKAHMRTHEERKVVEEPKNHVCDQCGRGFLWHCHLKQHMQTHTGLKPHVCDICGRRYAHSYNLTSHMQSHTNPAKHTCPTCGQICASASTLLIHTKRHSGIRPHTCTQCDRSFMLKANLVIHRKRHLGIKSHTCTECNRSFVLNSDLLTHMKRHSGDKPHACQECHRRFAVKSDLRKHMLIHSMIKPHVCSECHKSFSVKSDLRKHQRIHVNTRQFSCSQCDRNFSCERYLQNHMRLHSGDVFSCPVCNKNFTLKRSLKRHMLKNH